MLNCKKSYIYLDTLDPPPNKIPEPSTKPKSYHPPVLLTAYIAILSLNKLPMKENGAIKPCHTPPKKPYGSTVTQD